MPLLVLGLGVGLLLGMRGVAGDWLGAAVGVGVGVGVGVLERGKLRLLMGMPHAGVV